MKNLWRVLRRNLFPGVSPRAKMVEAEEVFEDFLIDFGSAGFEGMIGRQGLAGAGFGPDLCPVFGPIAVGIDGGVGGKDGAVEFFVGDAKPGRALVVQVGEGSFFEAIVPGGGGHDGRLADEGPGVGRDVGEIVGGVDALGDGVDPIRWI